MGKSIKENVFRDAACPCFVAIACTADRCRTDVFKKVKVVGKRARSFKSPPEVPASGLSPANGHPYILKGKSFALAEQYFSKPDRSWAEGMRPQSRIRFGR